MLSGPWAESSTCESHLIFRTGLCSTDYQRPWWAPVLTNGVPRPRGTALAGTPVIFMHSGFLVSLEAQASDLCASHQQSTGSWGSGVMHEVDRASPSPPKDALDRPCWITQSIETKGEDSPVLGCRCLEWIGGWEGMRVQQTAQTEEYLFCLFFHPNKRKWNASLASAQLS